MGCWKGREEMKQAHFLKNITLISQIGISMLTAVGICLGIGMWVDHKFGTNYLIWFLFNLSSLKFTIVYLLKSHLSFHKLNYTFLLHSQNHQDKSSLCFHFF